MTEMRAPETTRGPTRAEAEPTGWLGYIVFAAMMMILLGSLHAIAGLVALFNDDYYLVTASGLVITVDYTAWGWTHLILGGLAIAAGAGIFTGQMWARVTGIVLATISAIVSLAFVAAFPIWMAIAITLDVLAIYALSAHWRETASLR